MAKRPKEPVFPMGAVLVVLVMMVLLGLCLGYLISTNPRFDDFSDGAKFGVLWTLITTGVVGFIYLEFDRYGDDVGKNLEKKS